MIEDVEVDYLAHAREAGARAIRRDSVAGIENVQAYATLAIAEAINAMASARKADAWDQGKRAADEQWTRIIGWATAVSPDRATFPAAPTNPYRATVGVAVEMDEVVRFMSQLRAAAAELDDIPCVLRPVVTSAESLVSTKRGCHE